MSASTYTVHAGQLTYGKHAAFVPALSAALRLAASLPEWARVALLQHFGKPLHRPNPPSPCVVVALATG